MRGPAAPGCLNVLPLRLLLPLLLLIASPGREALAAQPAQAHVLLPAESTPAGTATAAAIPSGCRGQDGVGSSHEHARPFAGFQHPLAAPAKLNTRLAEQQAHAATECWLASYFNSSASQLTSVRLQRLRASREPPGGARSRALAADEAGPEAAALEAAAADQAVLEAAAADEAAPEAAAADEAAPEEAASGEGPRAAGPGHEEEAAADSGVADVRAPSNLQHCNASCLRAVAEEVLLERETQGGEPQLRWAPFEEDRQRWAPLPPLPPPPVAPAPEVEGTQPSPTLNHGECVLRQPGEAISRDFLVIAAVGNDWSTVQGWLDHPESATFDLVLLHYGNDTSRSCPRCLAVLHASGLKWTLVWQLMQHPSWPALAAGKRVVMVADDDVVMDTCTLNRAFEVFDSYGLLLGQPSLCPTQHRPSWYLHLVREERALLRFVTMVEIMAPMFEMDFFQGFVAPTLHDAYTGWGLDFVWPFLLHYPRDRVAVIDDVCMTHPHQAQQKQGEGSIYAALAKLVPYDAREEEARRDAQYYYYPSEMAALGFGYRPIETLGYVAKEKAVEQQRQRQQQQQQRRQQQQQQHMVSPRKATEEKQVAEQQQLQVHWQRLPAQQQRSDQAGAAVPVAAPQAAAAGPGGGGAARLVQPLMLYGQLSIMFGVVGVLVLCSARQRRVTSPSTPKALLPGHHHHRPGKALFV